MKYENYNRASHKAMFRQRAMPQIHHYLSLGMSMRQAVSIVSQWDNSLNLSLLTYRRWYHAYLKETMPYLESSDETPEDTSPSQQQN